MLNVMFVCNMGTVVLVRYCLFNQKYLEVFFCLVLLAKVVSSLRKLISSMDQNILCIGAILFVQLKIYSSSLVSV